MCTAPCNRQVCQHQLEGPYRSSGRNGDGSPNGTRRGAKMRFTEGFDTPALLWLMAVIHLPQTPALTGCQLWAPLTNQAKPWSVPGACWITVLSPPTKRQFSHNFCLLDALRLCRLFLFLALCCRAPCTNCHWHHIQTFSFPYYYLTIFLINSMT